MTDVDADDIVTRHPFIIHSADVTNDVTNWYLDIAIRTLGTLTDVLLSEGERAAGQSIICTRTLINSFSAAKNAV